MAHTQFLTVLLTLAAAVPAQREAPTAIRATLSGIVLDRGGRPWADAVVELTSQPLASIDASGPCDVLKARTDPKGRFKIQALRQRTYSAWASQRVDSGEFRVSAVAEGLCCGTPAHLEESAHRARPIDFRCVGVEAWAERGPLRLRVLPATRHGLPAAIALDAEHRATLPPLPADHCTIEVLDKGGVLLSRNRVELAALARRPELSLGAPRDFLIEVRDAATGKGVAGATVVMAVRGTLHPVGATGADGVATIRGSALRRGELFVRADGYAVNMVMVGGRARRSDWTALRAGAPISGHALMTPGASYTGRILIDGRPAPKVALLYHGLVSYATSGAVYVMPYERLIGTDQQGRFTLDGCQPGEGHGWLRLVLAPEQVRQLPAAWHRQLHPEVRDMFTLRSLTPGTRDVGDVDLARLCPVMFEVTDDSGRPAAGVRVVLGGIGSVTDTGANGGGPRTDHSGRVCVLTRPASDTVLVISRGESISAMHLDVRGAEADSSFAIVRHRLREPWEISGRVVTPAGKPIAGMQMYCELQDAARPPGLPAAAAGEAAKPGRRNQATTRRLDRATLRNCLRVFAPRPQVKTDAEGRFSFGVPPVPNRWMVSGHKELLFLTQRVAKVVEVTEGPVTGLRLPPK